jgi:hypothetical protein
MFTKPLHDLRQADLLQIISDEVRESDTIEFKEYVPGRDGPDGWHIGAEKVSDYGRDQIIREVLAFANAHGGYLFVGVEESKDKPARAVRIAGVPRCADLASRIQMYFRDLIEPALAPTPQAVAVPTNGDEGVLVISVPRSLNAPHRHKANLQSHIRRADRTEQMTMREIQDLTLQVERGIASLDAQFEKAARHFAELQRSSTGVALRATAIPLAPMSVPVPQPSSFTPPPRQRFEATLGREKFQVVVPQEFGHFRPILRGIRATGRDQISQSTAEIRETGLVELHFFRIHEPDRYLYVGWFLALACSALCAIDEARKQAAAPGTDYALELEVRNHMGSVATYGGSENGSWKTDVVPIVFPRYQVQSRDKFRVLIQLIERDFWNAIGQDRVGPEIEVEI